MQEKPVLKLMQAEDSVETEMEEESPGGISETAVPPSDPLFSLLQRLFTHSSALTALTVPLCQLGSHWSFLSLSVSLVASLCMVNVLYNNSAELYCANILIIEDMVLELHLQQNCT